jgi:hypothetical protein
MRRCYLLAAAVTAVALCLAGSSAHAQKHTGGSSPPTAPPPKTTVPQQPIVPVSAGMGSLQFVAVNYGVPAPQSLTRQLEADDDRTRSAALAAIGAPGQYLQRGHIPYAHSIQLDFVALGNTDELDAILTAELDQHLVSAILMPDEGNWRRVGTIVFPTPFFDTITTPATFLRTARSFTQSGRYRAIYHAYVPGTNGDYVENEAHLRILNGHAVVTISFVSSSRNCEVPTSGKNSKPGCDVTQRWLQADPTDPTRRYILVTATGRLSEKEANDPLGKARTFQTAHLRSFSCQPYLFSDTTQHYEPTAASGACTAAGSK